jgi:hypothetical protein
MLQSFGDTVRGSVIRYVTPFIMVLQEWIAANRELIRDKIDTFIQNIAAAIKNVYFAVRDLYPVIKAAWTAIAENLLPVLANLKNWAVKNQKAIIDAVKSFVTAAGGVIMTIMPLVKSAIELFMEFGPAILIAYGSFMVFAKVVTIINDVSAALKAMGIALTIATGPLGLIATTLGAIALGIGAVVVASKTIAAVKQSSEEKYRTLAKNMVSESEAARTQREREQARQQTGPLSYAAGRYGVAQGAGATYDTSFGALKTTGASPFRQQSAREKAINKLAAGPREAQLFSPYANEFGPISEEEAYRVQAKRWYNEDRYNRTTLTGKRLSDYLAANPDELTEEEAYRRLRESAASDSAKDDGIPDELSAALKKIEELLAGIDGGVNSLADTGSPGIPGRLNYAQMGQEDFWSLARAGI